jgi:zeaxanthin glucosyltransferase
MGLLSMKLGFICLDFPGHLNPMTALARQLQDRNHDVVFLYSSDAGGLPCAPGPEKDHLDKARPELSRLQGREALKFAFPRLLAQTETILKSLPAIVQTNGVDALALDTVQPYVELGAMQLGIPYIHVSVAMHRDYTGYTPLPQYGYPHENTPEALARNRGCREAC